VLGCRSERLAIRTRKSFKPEPIIALLLREARPTARELEGRPNILDVRDAQRAGREIDDTPDPRKAREAARARDIARAELVHLYREAKRACALDKLSLDIRFFAEDLIRANGGKLPKVTLPPGAPRKFGQRLLIALAVQEELSRLGPKRGMVTMAIKAVAERYGRSMQHVRDIFYNRHPDWQEALSLEIAVRQVLREADQPANEPPKIEGQEITPEQFKEYSALAAIECPNGMTVGDNGALWSWVRKASFSWEWEGYTRPFYRKT
jgi:hypothetical protein